MLGFPDGLARPLRGSPKAVGDYSRYLPTYSEVRGALREIRSVSRIEGRGPVSRGEVEWAYDLAMTQERERRTRRM